MHRSRRLAASLTAVRSARSCSPAAARVRVRRGRDLQHRLEQLRLDVLVLAVLLEHRLDRVGQRQRLGVEDHQLLLDPDREAGAGELRLHRPRRVRALHAKRFENRGGAPWRLATTASCTSSPSITGARSRRRCSGSRATRRPRRRRRSPTRSGWSSRAWRRRSIARARPVHGGRAGRRAVRRRRAEAGARARPRALDAGREVRPERVRLPVRQRVRRPHPAASTRPSRRCSCV